MSLRPVLRIAWRDAADVLFSRTYVVLVLAPLLLVCLLAFLVIVVTLLLSMIKVASPEGAPLGHEQVALVLPAEADGETKALYDELLTHLRAEAPASPQEARLARRFSRFLREAGSGTPAGVTSPPVGEAAAGGYQVAGLDVVAIAGEPWEAVRSRVPGTYDAAVGLMKLEGGQARYQLAYDPALLYSRTMERRLEDRLAAFNQARREARLGPRAVAFTVADRPLGAPDLWLVRALVFFTSLGLAFLYHSVAVQSVAGVLAGERESRTLEVLLSLPISHRQILYGKLLGLVLTTALPTLLWSAAMWVPLRRSFGITMPYGTLTALILVLLVWLMATGCAVSASSPNTIVAKNRLGTVNMAVFALGGVLMALPASTWPGGVHPIAGLVRVAMGGPSGYPALLLMLVLLLGTAIVILEAGLRGFRRT